ncbi:hypothetical protein E1301_Tti003392 [Triplophysa tibetana]|uniref:Uncharacterized protein n=1 Tax=Triplophysa tibetana TaxID=1572043 RepID=A0A5A9PNS2_9TELE|nr:hypothetical protein E1301_Tti003392 [Triplophysa tibetana]
MCVRPYASPGREVGFAGHSPVECAIVCTYNRGERKNSVSKWAPSPKKGPALVTRQYRPIRAVAVEVRARCCSPWGLPVSVPSREKVADGGEVSPSTSASGVPPVGAQEPEPMGIEKLDGTSRDMEELGGTSRGVDALGGTSRDMGRLGRSSRDMGELG